MENTELMEEEVIEEIIPVTNFTSGGGVKKVASYGIAAIAGALFLEFGIKPIWNKFVKGRIAKRGEELGEYEDDYEEEVR